MRCRKWSGWPNAAVLVAASVLAVVNGCQAALASAGCDAVNAGGFNIGPAVGPFNQIIPIADFGVGDAISFNVTLAGAVSVWSLGAGTNSANIFVSGSSTTQSYTVTGNLIDGQADTTLSEESFLDSSSRVTVTATCTPGDSTHLGSVQIGMSKLEAQTSGAAIGGAVGNAINDAFDGANPVTAGTNDLAFFFAPATQAQRFAQAFDGVLGYAEPDKRPSPFTDNSVTHATADRMWNAWADVRGTGWDGHDAASGTDGTQINLTAGIGRKLTPSLVVGVLGGYERFDYGASSLAGKLIGDGGSAGGYFGWRTRSGLRFDAAAVWSGLSYQATAGTATGSFDGSRWLVTGGVSGSGKRKGIVWTPSARVFALWEDQSAYTDSAAVAHAAQSFSEGRVSGGLKLAYPWMSPSGAWVTPYVGAYGDYRFGSDNATRDAPALASPEGMSARVTTGVAARNARDATLSLDGELGGLGGSYLTWSANAQVAVPF